MLFCFRRTLYLVQPIKQPTIFKILVLSYWATHSRALMSSLPVSQPPLATMQIFSFYSLLNVFTPSLYTQKSNLNLFSYLKEELLVQTKRSLKRYDIDCTRDRNVSTKNEFKKFVKSESLAQKQERKNMNPQGMFHLRKCK